MIVFLCAAGGAALAVVVHHGREPLALALALVAVITLVVAGATALTIRHTLRRVRADEADPSRRQIRQAAGHGRAPEDPALDQAALDYADSRDRITRWARYAVPGLFAASAAFGLYRVLNGDPVQWVAVGTGGSCAVTFTLVLASERRKLDRMRKAIRVRD